MTLTRRDAIAGLAANTLQLLSARLVTAQPISRRAAAAPPGALDLMLIALSPRTLRISISPADDSPRTSELGIVERQETKPLYAFGHAHSKSIQWNSYTIDVSENPLRISVREGTNVQQEVRFAIDSTNVQFNIDGPIFGLGEGVQTYDLRGTQDHMLNGEDVPGLKSFGARLPIPWVISPAGWGIFIGQPQGSFRFTQTEGTFQGIEATSTRNVYLVIGETPAQVLQEYAELTGYPHLPPLWSFGYQQSHRTVTSEEEIISVAKTFREKELPCDALIYLGTGFCPSGWNTGHGSFTFNRQVFPDPTATIRKLHERNFKVVLHMVPPGDFHGSVNDRGEWAKQAGDAALYWGKHVPLAKAGVDGWWPDEGDRLSVYARLQRNQMYWEGPRNLDPSKRPFALHRNGYAGLQRYGWLWSGDTLSTWEALRAQIMVGISTGLSGIPYWGSDTGGFVPTLEYTPELFVRWFQFSSFCPSFRSHGRAWKLHLPWGWGLADPGPKEVDGSWVDSWPAASDLRRPDVEQICRKFLNLRYQLLPYIYSMAAETHKTGVPMIRALWISYWQDKRTYSVADSFMWGDSILVAPIHVKDANERTVYLPQGEWWDYWSGERSSGGREIQAKARLDSIPMYVRAGAIIPTGPIKQYTGQEKQYLSVLRVYPGADGELRWYEDDGEGFEYEAGQHMSVLCKWKDQQRVLTLSLDKSSTLGIGREVRIQFMGTNVIKTAKITKNEYSVQF
jgi:alpha-glucosidase (family GH31 glycosyl hydrolase)